MTQYMMAALDRVGASAGVEPGIKDHFARRRTYTPLPSLHVGDSPPYLPLRLFADFI